MERWFLKSIILTLLTAGIAMGNSFVFVTPAGATTSGPVSAEADFTTSAGQIIVNLKNLDTANQMVDVAQALSDLSFTISGTGAAVNDANRTYTSTFIDVAANGAVTAASGTTNGWDFSGSGSSYLLEDLGSLAGPAQLILGGAGAASYTSANGSIAGNPGHNPFLQGSALFTLDIGGVTSATNITGATFSFGTTAGAPGSDIPGVPSGVPEPRLETLLMLVLMVPAVVYFRRKAPVS